MELITYESEKDIRTRGSCTQLVDAVMDGYVTWRAESAMVTATYENWTSASPDERSKNYEAYAAALGREERAASAYQGLLKQAAA